MLDIATLEKKLTTISRLAAEADQRRTSAQKIIKDSEERSAYYADLIQRLNSTITLKGE